MCGIAGAYSTAGSELTAVVRGMCSSIVHRGPDDYGEMVFGPVAIAMRRLAIIDLTPQGHQPMSNEDGSVWIVFNGEIYNYTELHAWLEQRGHVFRSRSDTEVIVHLFEELGRECVHRLRGMFAFAVWDERTRELFLARDHLGIKPLYYAQLPTGLIFASEIKALLAAGLPSRTVNLRALDQFLAFGAVPAPMTLLEDVHALPPGHAIHVRRDRLDVYRYWDLPAEEAEASPRLPLEPASTAVADVRELLEESIRLHQLSDVPFGAFLSGGVDSTAVVGLMARSGTQQVRTFAVGFSAGPAALDELAFARLAAERFGTEHSEHIVNGGQVLAELPKIVWHLDQPSVDGVNTYFVSRAAHEAGLKVALSGLGGDEVFGGYNTYRVISRWGHLAAAWGRLPAAARARAGQGVASLAVAASASGARAQKLRYLASVDSPVALYALARTTLWPHERARLMAEPVRAELGALAGPAESLGGYVRRGESLWQMVTRLEMRSFMGHRLLRDTDAMSMAHSLEVRVPLIDRRLVEFVGRLPARVRAGGGRPKHLLTAALKDVLPPEIVNRRKQGFEFPLGHWMRGELRAAVEEALSPETVRRRGLLSAVAVQDLYREFKADLRPWPAVWQLVVLESWLQHYVDRSPPVPERVPPQPVANLSVAR